MDGLGELPALVKKPRAALPTKQLLRDVSEGALLPGKLTQVTSAAKIREEVPKTSENVVKRRASVSATDSQQQSALKLSTQLAFKKLQDTRPVFPVLAVRGPVAGKWAPHDDDNTSIIRSLLEMVTSRAGPNRALGLQQIVEMILSMPKLAARVCEDIIDLKGISVMLTLFKSQEYAAQCLAAKVLQLIASHGYHKHILDLPASLPAVKHLLKVDSQEANAAAAGLMAALKPSAVFLETLPLLAKVLNFKSLTARIDAATAMHGLITSAELAYDIKDYPEGKLIEQVLHHMGGNPSERVRELCASMLATMSALTSRHRTKILRNDGMRILLERLDDTSATIVSNCMTSLLNMGLEERALKTLIFHKFDEKLAAISGGFEGVKYNTKLRDQAAQALNRLNALSKAETGKNIPIRELTSEQDLIGLSHLFTLLPTIYVCRTICRVSTAWRAAAMKATTWQRLELRQCSFLTDYGLRSFLSNIPLSSVRHLVVSSCKGLHSGIFLHLAQTLKSKLKSLDFSECDRVRDDALLAIFRQSEDILCKVNLSGCLALSNKTVFAATVHLEASLHELQLDRCIWLQDDGLMLVAGQCRNLRRIGISSCLRITQEGIKALHFSRSLCEIDISLNPGVTDEAFKSLAHSINLVELNVSGCENISNDGIACLKAFTNLTALDIGGNCLLSDVICGDIVKGCSKLSTLKCMMVLSITDETLRLVGNYLKQLTVCDLSYCSLISDIGLRNIARSCAFLRDLNLAWCQSLTSKGFHTIAENCRVLEALNLSQCPALEDAELLAFAQCTRLERLVLINCSGLSPDGINRYIQDAASKALRYLDVRGTIMFPDLIKPHPEHVNLLAGPAASRSISAENPTENERTNQSSPSSSPLSSPTSSPRRVDRSKGGSSRPPSKFVHSPATVVIKATNALRHGHGGHHPQSSFSKERDGDQGSEDGT